MSVADTMQGDHVRELAQRLDTLSATPAGASLPPGSRETVDEMLDRLESGELRAAVRDESGRWNAVPWGLS